MEKPEYIKNIENSTGNILSKLSLGKISIKDSSFDEKYYTLLFADLDFKDGEVFWKEKVLKTKHGFYLYVKRNIIEQNSIIDIYHNPEQLNELTLFVRQFIKQNKK